MALNPDALGTPQPTIQRSWTSKDVMLYALGVGAGSSDLAFATENSHNVELRVLPSYAVIVGHPGFRLVGIGDFNPAMLVHARQAIQLFAPIPPEGSVEVTGYISGLQDKGPGKHAIVDVTTQAIDTATGSKLLTNTFTIILRGAGGFGGPTPPASSVTEPTVPDREADVAVATPTTANQALVYRLSGDRNPLHSDPWFARERAGYPNPILHGLCSYGIAARALLETECGGDVAKFGYLGARFSAPVYPGETITTHIWSVDGGAIFRSTAGDDHRTVIDHGRFENL